MDLSQSIKHLYCMVNVFSEEFRSAAEERNTTELQLTMHTHHYDYITQHSCSTCYAIAPSYIRDWLALQVNNHHTKQPSRQQPSGKHWQTNNSLCKFTNADKSKFPQFLVLLEQEGTAGALLLTQAHTYIRTHNMQWKGGSTITYPQRHAHMHSHTQTHTPFYTHTQLPPTMNNPNNSCCHALQNIHNMLRQLLNLPISEAYAVVLTLV